MQLNEIRKELRFNSELLHLIETLKNIAGAQYHVMEKEKRRFEQFLQAFSGFFRVVNLVEVDNPLVRVVSDVLGVVIITSDSGFMGGLNQGVIRAAMQAIGSRPREKVSLVVLGDKGATAIGDRGYHFKFFRGVVQGQIYEQAVEARDYIVGEVLARRMGKVIVAHPRPLSFTAQRIDVINLLPCAELFDRQAESELSRRTRTERLIADATKVIVESSFGDMVEYLAGVWVTSKLYEVFEDSKLAEFSARAMHLEGSHQKVEKQYKKVKHMAAKAAHELIDKGMRESFAATKKKRERKAAKAA
jgi:ATP synthase F1 gamma subunit